MKYRGHNAKRDANEGEIVEALEAIGCAVHRLDQPVDLLVAIAQDKRNILMEVKDGAKVPSRRKKTDLQEKFFATWPGEKAIVTTPEQAVEYVNRMRRAGL